jgi:hypothetical protein
MSLRTRGVGAETGGVMLIIAGVAFWLERITPLAGVWRWLPLFVIYVGARDFREPLPGEPRTILPLLVGIWLQVSAIGFLGFDFLNSWPLLIVLSGLGLIIDGIIEGDGGEHVPHGE